MDSDTSSVHADNVGSDHSQHSGSLVSRGRRKEYEPAIARKESRAVCLIRLLFVAVLAASTVGVALAVHYYMTDVEQDEFEVQFWIDARKILESLATSVDRSLSAIDTYSVSITSTARITNQTWPFVTVPDFAVRGAKLLRSSKGVWLANYLKVSNAERAAWYNYTLAHDSWVDECIDVQEDSLNKTYFGPIIREWDSYGDIYSFETTSVAEAPFYFPEWQVVSNPWTVSIRASSLFMNSLVHL
jgi:hypothetical protein